MAYDDETLERVFSKTGGRCHICRVKLAFSNYGQHERRGAWEVEHSKARANGGTDHLNNLYAAHTGCNRSKGTQTTRSCRTGHGYRAAPLSDRKKQENSVIGGVAGALLATIFVPPPVRILAAMIGAIGGSAIGAAYEPD